MSTSPWPLLLTDKELIRLYLQQKQEQRVIIYDRYIRHLHPRVQLVRERTTQFASSITTDLNDVSWEFLVHQKLERDIAPAVLETLFPLPGAEVVNPAWENFIDGIRAIQAQQGVFWSLVDRLAYLEDLLHPALRMKTEHTTHAVAAAVAQTQRHSEIRRFAPAARREMSRLGGDGDRDRDRDPDPERTALAVVTRWLDILNLHPDLQDPLSGVERAARWLNEAARRADMITEVRSMLLNERAFRLQRAWARARESRERGEVVEGEGERAGLLDIPDDRSVADLRREIGHMAGFGIYSDGDRAALLGHFTDERVQRILDGVDDLTPDERVRNTQVQAVDIVGILRRLGL